MRCWHVTQEHVQTPGTAVLAVDKRSIVECRQCVRTDQLGDLGDKGLHEVVLAHSNIRFTAQQNLRVAESEAADVAP